MYDHHQSSSLMLTENHHIGWKMDRLPLKKRIIRYANFACSSSSSSSSLISTIAITDNIGNWFIR
ncbi:hypothetical protein DERF_003815 [Dermatophagoides farinae]|uniref:Uncharacterized protein n=1 Tax=Dermatophagoides farinae TaxID=6954 RepID=A0A922IFN1_DERFA|nr:hypothetical protein DERF_003815 [Dermatophagoides farinae]